MKKNPFIPALFVLLCTVVTTTQGQEPNPYLSGWDKLDLSGSELPVIMPYNRIIDPAGEQIYFGSPELENHALDCAMSPDGKILAIEGRYRIIFYDVTSRRLISDVIPDQPGMEGAENTYSGIRWYQKDGKSYLFWSVVGSFNRSLVLMAEWDGRKATITKTFHFEAVAPSRVALPNEIEIVKEDAGDFFIVALNGNNQVAKINIETSVKEWETAVGVAPYGLVAANGKLFVTNWAGSVPDASDTDVAGVPWGSAKVNPENGSTREGTVTVLDPATGSVLGEIEVGLHPNDIVKSPDEKFVYVANANSDHVSVIDTRALAGYRNHIRQVIRG